MITVYCSDSYVSVVSFSKYLTALYIQCENLDKRMLPIQGVTGGRMPRDSIMLLRTVRDLKLISCLFLEFSI